MSYKITEDCVGCGACAKKCPENAISGQPKSRHEIDSLFCSECGTCFKTCPRGAVMDPQGRRSPKKGKKGKVVRAKIDESMCAACKTCMMNCPHEAVRVVRRGLFSNGSCQVDPEKCDGCGQCSRLCIVGALKVNEVSPEDEP